MICFSKMKNVEISDHSFLKDYVNKNIDYNDFTINQNNRTVNLSDNSMTEYL